MAYFKLDLQSQHLHLQFIEENREEPAIISGLFLAEIRTLDSLRTV
jgi:hypothetical protein